MSSIVTSHLGLFTYCVSDSFEDPFQGSLADTKVVCGSSGAWMGGMSLRTVTSFLAERENTQNWNLVERENAKNWNLGG